MQILRASSVSQVFRPVIALVPIYVVNITIRPATMMQSKCDPVRPNFLIQNLPASITARVLDPERLFVRVFCVPYLP